MKGCTISPETELAREFDRLIAEQGYANRSEAVRDLIRDRLEPQRLAAEPGAACVASVSYVYDHHKLDLARRLTEAQHDHHDLVLANLHVHLDHHHCLESVLLRGPADRVRRFTEGLTARRGVRYGRHFLAPDPHTHAGQAPSLKSSPDPAPPKAHGRQGGRS